MMTRLQNVGAFHNASILTLHTYQALTLCRGKPIAPADPEGKHYDIPSVFDAGMKLNHIWHCARQDDPYADVALLEVERLLARAFEQLQRIDADVTALMAQHPLPEGLTLAINASKQASTVALDHAVFATIHAKQLIILVARYDIIVRALSTYLDFGLLRSELFRSKLYRATKCVRAVIMATTGFKKSNLSRQDIHAGTPEVKAVLAKLEPLPLAVLNRQLLPKWRPLGVSTLESTKSGDAEPPDASTKLTLH